MRRAWHSYTDYLNQRGGAERVFAHIAGAFPSAPIYTSIYNEREMGDLFPAARVSEPRSCSICRATTVICAGAALSARIRTPRSAGPTISWSVRPRRGRRASSRAATPFTSAISTRSAASPSTTTATCAGSAFRGWPAPIVRSATLRVGQARGAASDAVRRELAQRRRARPALLRPSNRTFYRARSTWIASRWVRVRGDYYVLVSRLLPI